MGKGKKPDKDSVVSGKPEGKPEEPASGGDTPATRRDFLTRAGVVAVCSCAAAGLAGSVRLAVPDFYDGPPERFPLGKPSDFKTGTLTWIREKELFVLRDEFGLAAFSSRCTHLGCTVKRTADGFFCPCHGARYDERGRVTQGPARDPLPWYTVWLEQDGLVWVDTGETVEVGTMRDLG